MTKKIVLNASLDRTKLHPTHLECLWDQFQVSNPHVSLKDLKKMKAEWREFCRARTRVASCLVCSSNFVTIKGVRKCHSCTQKVDTENVRVLYGGDITDIIRDVVKGEYRW